MAAGRFVDVRVYGLREFRAATLTFDRRLPRMADDAAHEAAELVARGARKGFPVGPAEGGHARDSIEATRKGDGWSVSAYGPRFPYGPWLDFGGSVNKHTGNPTRRAYFKKGRFIYPSFERNRPRIERIMETALQRHAESSGLDVD